MNQVNQSREIFQTILVMLAGGRNPFNESGQSIADPEIRYIEFEALGRNPFNESGQSIRCTRGTMRHGTVGRNPFNESGQSIADT